MRRAACPHTGCNYPEGDCLGTCACQLLPADQARRERDSLEAATWCAWGLVATLLVGACFALAGAIAKACGFF